MRAESQGTERAITVAPPSLATLQEQAQALAAKSRAPSTLQAYERDWSIFVAFCQAVGVEALPASTDSVAAFAAHLSTWCAPATVCRRVAGVAFMHRAAGFESPSRDAFVADVIAGIRRADPARRRSRALVLEDVERMCGSLPDDDRGLRDRVVLSVGYVAGLRRGELVALDVSDCHLDRPTVVLDVSAHKRSSGRRISVPARTGTLDTARWARGWIERVGGGGPLLRPVHSTGTILDRRLSPGAIRSVVRRAALAADLELTGLTPHSLRAGFVTDLVSAGVPMDMVAMLTGHASVRGVEPYLRPNLRALSVFRAASP